jgi:GalNAc-alpha-(1->4)-GalNAc-alpha-(1->3)-diNAcBac-PP-undecaprenol alpha-1,4-N-acetyl-D-galactosaminyltransferase
MTLPPHFLGAVEHRAKQQEACLQDTCAIERHDSPRRNSKAIAAHPARITLVVSGLCCGGIERAVVSLVGDFIARGHCVSVITFGDANTDFFQLPQQTSRLSLGIRDGASISLLKIVPTTRARLKVLHAAVVASRPDVVIAHAPQINVPTLLAMRGERIPLIVTEHGDVPIRPDAAKPWLWKKWVWYRLRRLCYRSAYKVVSASAAIDRNVAWLPQQRRAVIHNPFAPVAVQPSSVPLPEGLAPHRPWIASVGRLSSAKGFDVLLNAFARIAARFPQWQLVIVGDGELRERLRHQAGELVATRQVIFAGALVAPFELLRQAQFYVMASRYEGFPMALGEALCCGLPVIATDCPSRPRRFAERGFMAGGVRELIEDGVNGILVPSESTRSLADAMAHLIENPLKRQLLAQRAVASMTRYSSDKIVTEWEQLIDEARADALART